MLLWWKLHKAPGCRRGLHAKTLLETKHDKEIENQNIWWGEVEEEEFGGRFFFPFLTVRQDPVDM